MYGGAENSSTQHTSLACVLHLNTQYVAVVVVIVVIVVVVVVVVIVVVVVLRLEDC